MNPDNTELLKQINTPADLRKLQVSELPQCVTKSGISLSILAHLSSLLDIIDAKTL